MQYITNMEPNLLLPLLANKQGTYRSVNLQNSPWGALDIQKNVKIVWRGNCNAIASQLKAFGCSIETTPDPGCLSTLKSGDSVIIVNPSTSDAFGWYIYN